MNQKGNRNIVERFVDDYIWLIIYFYCCCLGFLLISLPEMNEQCEHYQTIMDEGNQCKGYYIYPPGVMLCQPGQTELGKEFVDSSYYNGYCKPGEREPFKFIGEFLVMSPLRFIVKIVSIPMNAITEARF